MKFDKRKIKRILVIGGHGIGDNMFAASVIIGTVRKNFPKIFFMYCLDPVSSLVLKGNPSVDKILPVDSHLLGIIAKTERFDLAIDTVGHADTAQISYVSGARCRVGYKVTALAKIRPDLYNIRLNHSPKINRSGRIPYYEFIHIAKNLGLEVFEERRLIFLKKEEVTEGENILKRMGLSEKDFIIGMHPFGSKERILWEPKKFAELARILIRRHSAKVLFFYGSDEEKNVRKLASRVNDENCFVSPKVSIREWLALLSLCNLFIANDRGPMHIAPHLGIPTVGIFGPFSPKEWFPYSKEGNNLFITKGLSCQHCGDNYRFCPDLKCIRLLKVEEVYKKMRRLLAKNTNRKWSDSFCKSENKSKEKVLNNVF